MSSMYCMAYTITTNYHYSYLITQIKVERRLIDGRLSDSCQNLSNMRAYEFLSAEMDWKLE